MNVMINILSFDIDKGRKESDTALYLNCYSLVTKLLNGGTAH